MGAGDGEGMTFWEHLDELRRVFFRIGVAVVAVGCVAFGCKELLFEVVLAPHRADFVLYRWLGRLSEAWGMPSLRAGDFQVELINTQLTSQFMTHMTVALYAGVLVASPYVIYCLFRFVSPGLHASERRVCRRVLVPAFLLFVVGILVSYFLIFPLSFRFLATYQVDASVVNMISLSSYVECLGMLSLMMGAAFEVPVLAYFLGRLGLVDAGMLRRWRRHSVVGILVVAAVITPTSDVFTLLLVSVPLYLLYELSIWVVSRSGRRVRREL